MDNFVKAETIKEIYNIITEDPYLYSKLLKIIISYKKKLDLNDEINLSNEYFNSLNVNTLDVIVSIGQWDLNFKKDNILKSLISIADENKNHKQELDIFNHIIEFLKILYPIPELKRGYDQSRRDYGTKRYKRKTKKRRSKTKKRRSKRHK